MADIQKASLVKRFAAFLLDFILIVIAVSGLAWGFSAMFKTDSYARAYYAKEEAYNLEAQIYLFGHAGLRTDVIANQAEYDALSDDKKASYTKEKYDDLSDEEKDKYMKAYNENSKMFDDRFKELFNSDAEAVYNRDMYWNLLLITASLSIAIAILIFEFVFPLIFKNGRTIGKKVVGIAVVCQNGVKANHIVIFTRALLGKLIVEIMIPLILIFTINYTGWIALLVLALIGALEVFVFLKGKKFTPLHDVICQTICVDNATQMIFNSVEELNAYKAAMHAEEVRTSTY